MFSGVAIAGFAILGFTLALLPQLGAKRSVGAVFFLTAVAYAINECPALREIDDRLEAIVRPLRARRPECSGHSP